MPYLLEPDVQVKDDCFPGTAHRWNSVFHILCRSAGNQFHCVGSRVVPHLCGVRGDRYIKSLSHRDCGAQRYTLNTATSGDTYSKVRGEGPLLDWLVVGGLTPHEGQVESQAGVIHTHHHG